jgi:hypothetical protein
MTFSIADDFAQAFDDLGEFLRRDPPEAFSNPLYGQRPDLEGFARPGWRHCKRTVTIVACPRLRTDAGSSIRNCGRGSNPPGRW